MSFKFEEVTPKRSLTVVGTAPLSDIRVIDYSKARTGYEFQPLTEITSAPDYGFKFCNAVTGEEINVWLRYPDGLANPSVNWGVMEDRLASWLDTLRTQAERQLDCRLVFAREELSLFTMALFHTRDLSDAQSYAKSIIDSLRRRFKDDSKPYCKVECYETAPGRRYRIESYMGHGFAFKMEPLGEGKQIPEGRLYGTTRLRDASYRFQISHNVLGDQLPTYYDGAALQRIVDEHLRRYAGDLRGAVGPDDFMLDWEGISK
ncbi:hypothetical protein [Burkholderia phage FLC9]|nr:hypothetical protein [Burkholderia phage FLC9]